MTTKSEIASAISNYVGSLPVQPDPVTKSEVYRLLWVGATPPSWQGFLDRLAELRDGGACYRLAAGAMAHAGKKAGEAAPLPNPPSSVRLYLTEAGDLSPREADARVYGTLRDVRMSIAALGEGHSWGLVAHHGPRGWVLRT